MVKAIEGILLGAENAKNLADFYINKVGLKLSDEAEMGENFETALFIFELSGCNLYIVDHSEVKGKNASPMRVMFNLEVDDIEEEVKRFEQEDITMVGELHHVEGYGYIATFEDSEGNYFQLVQTKEKSR